MFIFLLFSQQRKFRSLTSQRNKLYFSYKKKWYEGTVTNSIIWCTSHHLPLCFQNPSLPSTHIPLADLSVSIGIFFSPAKFFLPISAPPAYTPHPKNYSHKNKTLVCIFAPFRKRDLKIDDHTLQHKRLIFIPWVTLICFALKHTWIVSEWWAVKNKNKLIKS